MNYMDGKPICVLAKIPPRAFLNHYNTRRFSNKQLSNAIAPTHSFVDYLLPNTALLRLRNQPRFFNKPRFPKKHKINWHNFAFIYPS